MVTPSDIVERSMLTAVTTVRTVNSSIAKLLSTSDDARFYFISSSNTSSNNIAIFGTSSVTNDVYLSINSAGNNMFKLASFSESNIKLNAPIKITGHLSVDRNLGSLDYKWRDLYLNGSNIHIGYALIQHKECEPIFHNETFINKDILFQDKRTSKFIPISAEYLKIESSDDYSCEIKTGPDGPIIISYDNIGAEINRINFAKLSTSMLPEGTNKYFNEYETLRILSKYSIDSSDYAIVTSNQLIDVFMLSSNYVLSYSDVMKTNIEEYLSNSSNLFKYDILYYDSISSNNISNLYLTLTDKIASTSNTLTTLVYTLDSNISNYVNITSNILSSNISTNISSNIINTINHFNQQIDVQKQMLQTYFVSTIYKLNSNLVSFNDKVRTELNSTLTSNSSSLFSNIDKISSDTSNNVKINILSNINEEITTTSNTIISVILDQDVNISNYIRITSNELSSNCNASSNNLATRLVHITADQVSTIDSVQRFIVNNVYKGDLITSNLTLFGSLLPSLDGVFDLGSSNNKWKEAYVGANSLYIGDNVLSVDNTTNSLKITNNNKLTELIVSSVKLEDTAASGQYKVLQSIDNKLSFATALSGSEVVIENITTDKIVQGANEFYTSAKAGTVAEGYNATSCNIAKVINDKLISDINNISANQIADGTTKNFIVNNQLSTEVFINGSITASNLHVIGEETRFKTEKYTAERLDIVSESLNSAALTIQQKAVSQNIAEFYKETSALVVINKDGKVGIGTIDPQATLDVQGNIYFTGKLNNISHITMSYLNTVNSNIQKQIDDVKPPSESLDLREGSNKLVESLAENLSSQSNLVQYTSNLMFQYLTYMTSNFSNLWVPSRDTINYNIVTNTYNAYSNLLHDTSNNLVTSISSTADTTSNLVASTSDNIRTQLSTNYTIISTRLNDHVSDNWNVLTTYIVKVETDKYTIDNQTNNPPLTLYTGNTYAFDLTNLTNNQQFAIQDPDGNTLTGALSGATSGSGGILYWSIPTSYTTGAYKYICSQDASMSNIITITQNADPTTKRNYLYSNKRVGIGIFPPLSNLDVEGSIKFSGTMNNVTAMELSYLKNISTTSNIQSQLQAISKATSNYTETTSNNIRLIIDYQSKINTDINSFQSDMNSAIANTNNLENRRDIQINAINDRLTTDVKPNPWSQFNTTEYILDDKVAIGTSSIGTNRLEIAGGNLQMTTGNIKRILTGNNLPMPGPIIWYQFNENPTLENIKDYNTISSTKHDISLEIYDKPIQEYSSSELVSVYKFDDANNIGIDNKGTNTLNNNNVVIDTTDYINNKGSVLFNGNNYLSSMQGVGNTFSPNEFSLSFWCKVTSNCGFQPLISCFNQATNQSVTSNYGWMLQEYNGALTLVIAATVPQYGATSNILIGNNIFTSIPEWKHIFMKLKNDNVANKCILNVFVNANVNKEDIVLPYQYILNNLPTATFNIGYVSSHYSDSHPKYIGSAAKISDVRFYNESLPKNNVNILYGFITRPNYTNSNYKYKNALVINNFSNFNYYAEHYIKYTNTYKLNSLFKTFYKNNGFSVHFVIQTSDVSKRTDIFEIYNVSFFKLFIAIVSNNLLFQIYDYVYGTGITNNTVYTVDFIFEILDNKSKYSFTIYVNGVAFPKDDFYVETAFFEFSEVAEPSLNFLKPYDTKHQIVLQDFRIYPYALTLEQVAALQTGKTTYTAATAAAIENYQVERWKDNNVDGAPKVIYYSEGNVSIGSDAAPSAKLHVYSSSSLSYTGKYFNGSTSITNVDGITTLNTSAKFDSSILVKNNVIASSDARIKKNIQDINDDSALDKILSIEPKTYNYVDFPIRRSEKVYGFIAQQIKEVIPEAVKMQKGIVPNIFCIASCFLNVVTFSSDAFELYSQLFEGGIISEIRISLIDLTGYQSTYTIQEVNVGSMSITLDRNIQGNKVFVYGTEVADFHALDKNYIFTLNVCATQRLSDKIDILLKRISYLEYISQK